ADYRKAVLAGELPVARGRPVTRDDLARREIIDRLMCTGAVDVAAIARAHGLHETALAPDPDRLAPLLADGIVAVEGARLRVDADHWSFLRLAAACFDAYLDAGVERHSRAV